MYHTAIHVVYTTIIKQLEIGHRSDVIVVAMATVTIEDDSFDLHFRRLYFINADISLSADFLVLTYIH